METTAPTTEVFKKPSFLPQKLSKFPPTEPAEKEEPPKKEETIESEPEEQSKSDIKPSVVKSSSQPIPYSEPSWGGLPDVSYSLEEMKNGVSLRTIPLDKRSFYCFGRLDSCHVVMAHPTISRFHAILQFRATFSETDEKKGFYLYDLGSTHGTFLNKMRIKPKMYVKIQVGHMIKFGSSTRFFLLHGPEDDQEEESQYTFSQLAEMRREELERRKNEEARIQQELEQREKEEEARGIDWGMGEDADEETDLTVNPFALTTNEELYIDDPKKALRNWFEREGDEPNYNVSEKGFGQFRCTIELPIENPNGGYVTAEATISGKKKEAIYQCALEACRILDRAGLLKQGNQESKKRKFKNWEEDDYYDSDEDSFFDRTGDLEMKRKQRMNQVKKTQPVADTYETLIEKHKSVLKEIDEIEQKFRNSLVEFNSNMENSEDSLESYMSQMSKGKVMDKLEIRKFKTTLSNLKANEERLRKLINFVKPFELPEIKPHTPTKISEPIESSELSISKKETKKVEKLEDESKESQIEKVNLEVKSISTSPEKSSENDEFVSPATLKKARKGPTLPPANKTIKAYANQYEEDFNNIVWTPPAGQTGDGRTSLNDKYGY